MSKRAKVSGVSLLEYCAAEDRLLDILSPPHADGDGEAASSDAVPAMEAAVDPSRDNMVPFISDDLEIHSLLASSVGSDFKGFDDEPKYCAEGINDTAQPLIFGMLRHAMHEREELLADEQFISRLTPKHPQITDTPIAMLEADPSAAYMLTNGHESDEQQLDMDADCVIYDEDGNVLLNDEQCCEIIVADHGVHTEHTEDIERTYLMSDNGEGYDSDQDAEPHVYLSDAALDRQQYHHHQQQEQHQLHLDAAEEEDNQVSDVFVDERPDICEVYDHEMEEQDDEQENSFQLVAIDHQQEVLCNEEEHQQEEQAPAAMAAVAHSSTTEFPVSSTSMPNGSDYDDFDDDVGTAEEKSPQAHRKYMLKNTLSAEALDRRLVNICQSQQQMSLSEKVESWNCAPSCEAVEDVENFEAAFAQQEAAPEKQPKFKEFLEMLLQSTKITQEIEERAAVHVMEATVTPDTPYSSEEAAIQKRPNYRRLLHVMPAAPSEPIVLDDNDDEYDDDCYEVMVNPSSVTLVPEQSYSPIVKTMQTQTHSPVPLETKETSTTDLVNRMAPSVSQQSLEQADPEESHQHMEDQEVETQTYMEYEQQEEQHQSPVRSISGDCQNDAKFYEQHEFCNYLGLTELSTANAVANAMRELANSNVARRSLRVRTQQQLDRMRSDVRGRRRERQQQKKLLREQQQQHNIDQQLHPLTSDSSSISSNGSSSKKGMTPMGNSAAPPSSNTFVYPRPFTMSTGIDTVQAVDFYYSVEDADDKEPHDKALLEGSDFRTMSLNAAFANVYAAAAPAQTNLLECMQSRLRQAREAKPSIYIVKAMNNAISTNTTSTRLANPGTGPFLLTPTDGSVERLQYNNQKTEKAPPSSTKVARKSVKKVPANAPKRRRNATTAARDLVTRSTTHMNSKLLRNRKVNLLKSYELTNATAQGRGKQRLSGGSTVASKRLNTPKEAKKSLRKTETAQEQVVISHASSTQQHRLDHQQTPPKSPKKPKATRQLPSPQEHQPQQEVQKANIKRKRFRAKSLPTPQSLDVGDSHMVPASPEMSPIQPKLLMDMHGFLTNQAIVSPPIYSAAVRRFVNDACKSREQLQHQQQEHHQPQQQPHHQPQQHQSQQLQKPPEGFYDLSASFSQLPKPSLIYPPLSPPPSQRTPHFSRRERQVAGTTLHMEGPTMAKMQIPPQGGLFSLNSGSTALRNPLAGKNGKVLYLYYELEQLIVLQEKLISFWKYSKVFSVLRKTVPEAGHATANQQHSVNIFGINTNTANTNQSERKSSTDTNKSDDSDEMRWVYLGGTRRMTSDIEVPAPHGNRLCAHNSTPVYIEMRCHPLDHHKRESKLLSLYVNVYYYCEEELRPKMHSVHLDAVNCEWNEVIFTTISESRYFVMAWQQEVIVGKPRAGICKYSLMPTLDTLASIREFKKLRHELRHIECLTEDRLIGYGSTRITIWDQRSGDTLMNYDFGFQLGHNMGVVHFPSFEMDLSSVLILYQHVKEPNMWPELRIIACELSHATPSHRLLHVHRLPSPQFDCQLVAINTGDHVILKSPTDDEIWVSTSDPRQLTYLAPQGTQRFYTRQKSQIITMTTTTLAVDSIANHVLKLATNQQDKMMAAMGLKASSSTQLPLSA